MGNRSRSVRIRHAAQGRLPLIQSVHALLNPAPVSFSIHAPPATFCSCMTLRRRSGRIRGAAKAGPWVRVPPGSPIFRLLRAEKVESDPDYCLSGTFVKDEFTQPTKDTLAKRAGGLCSNPECRRSTFGAKPGQDGYVNIGEAAHITAAAPGGPRYDPFLTPEQRRSQSNGVWLCQTCSDLVDSDSERFTIETLLKWKRAAEDQAFHAIIAATIAHDQRIEAGTTGTAERELIERLGLAAQTDLTAFKRMPGWPQHAISLNLRMTDSDSVRAFNVSALAAAVETFNEIVIIAPPGTGKTTTLLQVTETILSQGESVAVFIPLGEWSSRADSFFLSIVRRHAFDGVLEEHLQILAHCGRLLLVIDGWNELDATSRKRASHEIRMLQREFPSLGLIVSTRRQVLDVPISARVVEIDALAESQQLEIARALRGPQGEALLDHAWRTPGVHELVAIPLYLTALLAHTQGETLPTTKEEVLRLFITEHERATDKAEALHTALLGFHKQMLTALAVEATYAANTTISDSRARTVVKRIEDQLVSEDQIRSAPQPTTVLDVLISHHLLVRSGVGTGAVSFQHQQFQEWYASFEVERLIRTATAGTSGAMKKLRADVLNMPVWEEPILFACERVSRTGQAGTQAVATSVLETMAIDPMLAAEMIYRSSADVWDQIREKVIAFVGHWHVDGRIDRAVHFMISTGRSDFAPQIWPLISSVDDQVHLKALRAGRRFRPSVLGADVQARIAQLPEEVRKHILSEIVHQSGLDGIELAARLAQADASPKVQASVIEALQFRSADRFVKDILLAAPDEVWRLLARAGYAEEIADPDAAARLRDARQHYIESETDPLRKLRALLDAGRHGVLFGLEVGALIESADFPVDGQDAGWFIAEAGKLYPEDTTSAILHRLEAGRKIPFRTEDLLRAAGVSVDEGPLVDLVMTGNAPERVIEAAVTIVGPNTVGRLIERMARIDAKLKESKESGIRDESIVQEYWKLSDWISKTALIPFVQAVLCRSTTDDPLEIVRLADLVARHGKDETEGRLQLEDMLYKQMIAAAGRWADILLATPTATRAQFADVAQTIERLAAPELFPVLQRLLAEDLVRWRHVREKRIAARASGEPIPGDAITSWTLQYRRAFAAIGDSNVIELMKEYLPDAGYYGFGIDAAYVLKAIYDRQKSPKSKRIMSVPDFSEVKAKQVERQNGSTSLESSEFADAIIAVINGLVKPEAGEDTHRHALQLARVAFSMPYGNKMGTINTLLDLPRPPREKQALLAILVCAGEIIHADMVLDGIKILLEDAKKERWRLDENHGEVEGWLELLPFSDRPAATLEGLELLEANLRSPWRLRRLLSALGHAPSPEAESMLGMLPRIDARFLSEHDWLTALEKRGTVSAVRMLLELITEGVFTERPGGIDTWILSRTLEGAMRAHTDFRAEVYQQYKRLPPVSGKAILEQAIAEAADADGVLVIARSHATQGRPFNGILHSAIRHAAVGQRPSADWVGANEVFSVPLPELRKSLFALIKNDTAESKLASACLTAIDEFRDDYGPAESEPRHPDIDSGRPWPLAAG